MEKRLVQDGGKASHSHCPHVIAAVIALCHGHLFSFEEAPEQRGASLVVDEKAEDVVQRRAGRSDGRKDQRLSGPGKSARDHQHVRRNWKERGFSERDGRKAPSRRRRMHPGYRSLYEITQEFQLQIPSGFQKPAGTLVAARILPTNGPTFCGNPRRTALSQPSSTAKTTPSVLARAETFLASLGSTSRPVTNIGKTTLNSARG